MVFGVSAWFLSVSFCGIHILSIAFDALLLLAGKWSPGAIYYLV